MLKKILPKLRCPICQAGPQNIDLVDFAEKPSNEAPHVENGALLCRGCGAAYTISDGILEIVPRGLCDEEARSEFTDRFRRVIEQNGLLTALSNVPKTPITKGYEDQLLQKQHFDWYSENNQQSYIDYQNTPFWKAFDASTVERWQSYIEQGNCILDLGCGDARGGFYFLQNPSMTLVGLDVSSQMLKKAIGRAHQKGVYDHCSFMVADGNDPPFVESSFDLALTYGLLHHLPNPGRTCRLLQKLLCAGGTHLATENNRTILRPFFDLLMKVKPLWFEKAGKEPVISRKMVEDWLIGLPVQISSTTSVFLPPHLFNMAGLNLAKLLLKASDTLALYLPSVATQGGLITFEVRKTRDS